MTSTAKLRLATGEQTIRAALYCRYSADVQNDRSIERQRADLEKAAPRLNLKLDDRLYFSDRGTSATTLFERPGLTRQLLEAAERKLFDVVLVEHTDRLARKQADQFWLAEQFKLLGIRIFTPSGEVDPLRLTFESYQNEQFSVMLSTRVKSGHNDAVREGRIPHKLGYGYNDVKDKPGEKIINTEEAKAVVRIFREYASGMTPPQIALGLTRDGVATPGGAAEWTFQTIHKFLINQIYVGIYVRNKVRRVRNYNTGKRDVHPASPDDLMTIEVPHLRIVDRDLWDAAQKVRADRSTKSSLTEKARPVVTRKVHPFAGLFRCASCGSKMIICGSSRDDRMVACSTAWWKQSCPHRKRYSLDRLTQLATDRMHAHLTDPEFVKERAQARAKELGRMERENGAERETAQREKDRVDLKIRKLVRLTEDDEADEVPQEVLDRLKELRVEQRGLQQRLTMLDAKSSGVIPHPSAVKALGRDVDTLHALLKSSPDDPACRIALNNLMEMVSVHPTDYGQPYDVSLYARHAAYVGELPLFPEFENKKVQNYQTLGRGDIINAIVPSLTLSQPVYLGRWREAA